MNQIAALPRFCLFAIAYTHLSNSQKSPTICADMNFLTYAKKKAEGFDESPFNIVDAVLLSWLSYTDFDTDPDHPLSLAEYAEKSEYLTPTPHLDCFLPKKSAALMKALHDSKRYQSILVLRQKRVKEKKGRVEFKATAFDLGDLIVIGFEGTTPCYIGWEEDFVLSFKEEIASYPLAIEFVGDVLSNSNKNVVILGHSKGGHIAAYCLYALQRESRIQSCYSFEGPGFRDKKVLDYLKSDSRYTKIVPSDSIVGMLFNCEDDIKIIRSLNVAVFQHNPLEWVIRGDDFIYLKKRSLTSSNLDKSINGWINAIVPDDRERFTKILFGALDSFEAQDFATFFRQFPRQIRPAHAAYKALSKEDRVFFNKVIRQLIRHLANPNVDKKAKKKKTITK